MKATPTIPDRERRSYHYHKAFALVFGDSAGPQSELSAWAGHMPPAHEDGVRYIKNSSEAGNLNTISHIMVTLTEDDTSSTLTPSGNG